MHPKPPLPLQTIAGALACFTRAVATSKAASVAITLLKLGTNLLIGGGAAVERLDHRADVGRSHGTEAHGTQHSRRALLVGGGAAAERLSRELRLADPMVLRHCPSGDALDHLVGSATAERFSRQIDVSRAHGA